MKVHECIGCGFCCCQAPCDAGIRLYNGAVPCPALEWHDDEKRHKCRLMCLPGNIGRDFRLELYAGAGCCSNLNTWRREPLVNRTKTLKPNSIRNPVQPEMQAFMRCLAREFISGDKISLTLMSFKNELMKMEYSEESAEIFCRHVLECFNQNRTGFMEDFMG